MEKLYAAFNNSMIKTLIDATDLNLSCWTKDGVLIYASKALLDLFSVSNLEEYSWQHNKFIPQSQPGGEDSSALWLKFFEQTSKDKICTFDWSHNILNSVIRVSYELKLVEFEQNEFILSTLHIKKDCDLHSFNETNAEMRAIATLNAAPIAITYWNREFEAIDCNDQTLKMFGYTCKKDFLKNIYDAFPVKQPNGLYSSIQTKEIIANAFRAGSYICEWVYLHKDGTEIPCEVTLVRVKHGNEHLIVEYTRDLSEIVANQEKANAAEVRTSAMLESLPIGVNLWNEKLELVDCNLAAMEMLGIESKSQYFQDFYHCNPDLQSNGERSVDLIPQYITEAFETGHRRFDWTFKTVYGEPVFVEVSLIRAKIGEEYMVAAYQRDLSEIITSKAIARDAVERAQIMLDTTPLCANFWNKDFENIDCNLAAVKLFDLKNKQEYLNRFFELSPEYQPNGMLSSEFAVQKITQAFQEGYSKFEWMHQKLDGEPIPSEITLIRTEYHGEFIVTGYTNDLREWKASEERLRAAEQRAQVMLDTTPLCANFWNSQFENIDCNLAAMKLFGFDNKEEYLKSFSELSPVYQPDGKPSSVSSKEKISTAFDEGFCSFEWMHQKLDGEFIPSQVTLIRTEHRGESIVVGYTADLRKLKQSEERLREAEERAQVMLDTTPLCANFWNSKFENIDCNLAAVKLFNLNDKQEYLDRFFELSPEFQPDGQTSAELAHKNIITAFNEGYCKFEWMHQNLDGEPIPAEITLIRTKFRDEFIVTGYTKDLRELKHSEELLREAEERTQIMLDTTPLCANFWNSKFENLDCNLAAVKLFGLENKQEYLDRFFELSPEFQPDGRTSAEAAYINITTAFDEGYCKFEWMHQKINGEPIPAEITLIRTEHRGESIVVGFTQDLRELRQSQAQVREAETRIQSMFNATPLCIKLWDDSYNLIDCNEEALMLFGFEDKQDLLNNFDQTLPELQSDGRTSFSIILEKLATALKDGYCRFESTYLHYQTEESIPAEVTLVRIKIRDRFAIVSYLRDLREFKAMLEEILAVEKDLRTARDAAEKSAQAKSEFLANMSHEIRTPMNGILGLLYLLSQTKLNETQDEYVQKVLYSANNLLRIINDILDFSKIDAGKLELEYIPFTFNDICEELHNLFAPRAEEKKLFLAIDCGDSSKTTLLSDPLRIKQIVFNLVSNALKFTEQGGVSVNVLSEVRDDNTVFCKLSVKDTGIGLNKDQIGRIFSAFSQADSSVTRKYGGTGLGLVISKSIAHMLGGNISIESEPNEGSTFSFECTFNIAQEADNNIFHYDTLEGNQEQKLSGHILLVEDNEINQLIADELLKSEGYTLEIAINGQEAIDMLEKKHFDLVLMDIQMPIMDGLTATQKIRQNAAFEHLPIVAMSAHAMSGDKDISIAHGMNDHITKPIDPIKLYNTIQYWLRQNALKH